MDPDSLVTLDDNTLTQASFTAAGLSQDTSLTFPLTESHLQLPFVTDCIVITIQPSGYEPFLSLSNKTVNLPILFSKYARIGDMTIQVTATGSPAKEAVYTVEGILFAEGVQSDIKEFDLKVRQE